MITALHLGAEAIIPVSEIPEALAARAKDPKVRLAGERHGLRIGRDLTGGIDFDFGNSPRDFTREKVAGQTIVWTTTNGTRALRACAHAEMILVGALLNLRAIVDVLEQLRPAHLLIVCSGTFEEVAYEDTFAAGALIDALGRLCKPDELSDSSHIALGCYQQCGKDPRRIATFARNGRKLLSTPALADDVSLCLQRDTIPLTAGLMADGSVRPWRGFAAKLA
jgi:2-phosphosulfolactate phosphatase